MTRGHIQALCIGVAAALLSACRGQQFPLGRSGAMPAAISSAGHANGKSWMLPEASRGDLLYVSDDGANAVYVFSYPGGRYVGTLTGLEGPPQGVCSDGSGNVFVDELNFGNSHIQEFAHGGTVPIAILDAPGEATKCAVDPTTGNLAVVIYTYGSGPTGVAVYPGAQGNPRLYSDPTFVETSACSYDGLGDLFIAGENAIEGFALAELPAGNDTFTDIALKSKVNPRFLEPIEWENKHLAIGSTDEFTQDYVIYRVAIAATKAKVVGSTHLLLKRGYFTGDTAFSIRGPRIVLTENFNFSESRAGFWKYPAGGAKLNETPKFGSQYSDGVAISLAPSR